MKSRILPYGSLLLSLLLAGGALRWNPFLHASNGLASIFAAGPDWAQISLLYKDPKTQEVTNGENPAPGLEELTHWWGAAEPGAKRIFLMGNSQTYTVLLAPGEFPLTVPEKTYPDLLADFYRQKNGNPIHLYRLSAPNISYMEMLWYLTYMTQSPELKPSAVLLQVNYEEFRKTGIRSGLLTLLPDPKFYAAIRKLAENEKPYSGIFKEALSEYDRQLAAAHRGGNPAAGAMGASTHTGIAQSNGWGNLLETKLRATLEQSATFRERHNLKTGLLNFLYLCRVYFLHIKPTTPRSLGPAQLAAASSSLDEIAQLCAQNQIKLAIFNAPQNPLTPLYKTAADRATYERTIRELALRRQLRFYDFESAVPGPYWGVWIDGPDPIHIGRAAHQILAEKIEQSRILEEITEP